MILRIISLIAGAMPEKRATVENLYLKRFFHLSSLVRQVRLRNQSAFVHSLHGGRDRCAAEQNASFTAGRRPGDHAKMKSKISLHKGSASGAKTAQTSTCRSLVTVPGSR
jgi:hypothetical protein